MKTEMTTNKRIIICFLLFAANAGFAFSQDDDFGIWLDVNARHEIFNNLNVELAGSVRTSENSSKVDQYFAEGGLSYKLNRHFTAGSSYRLIRQLENDSEYYFRHKFFLYIKGTLPVGRFDFSGKLMYQRTVQTYIENNNDLIPNNYARLKLKTEYTFPVSAIKPYVYFEPFIPVFNDNVFEIKKFRISAGAEFRISGRSSIEAGYIYEDYNKSGAVDMHIASITYNINF
jgi:hypothetical protein